MLQHDLHSDTKNYMPIYAYTELSHSFTQTLNIFHTHCYHLTNFTDALFILDSWPSQVLSD
jgi:hypothetical protein